MGHWAVSSMDRIWKPVRDGVHQAGATAGDCAPWGLSGFERAAEDPLGARE